MKKLFQYAKGLALAMVIPVILSGTVMALEPEGVSPPASVVENEQVIDAASSEPETSSDEAVESEPSTEATTSELQVPNVEEPGATVEEAATTFEAPENYLKAAKRMVGNYITRELGRADDSFVLGAPIPEYLMEDGEISLIENSLRYPVFLDNSLIGIFEVNAIDTGDPCFAFGEGYSKKLAKSTSDATDDYCLVSTIDETFVYSGDTVKSVQEHNLSLNNQTRSVPISSSEIKNAMANYEDVQYAEHSTLDLPIDIKSSRLVESVWLSPWRDLKFNQGNTKLCWAVTSWEIGEWELFDKGVPGISTPYEFADHLNKSYYQTGNLDDANECLEYFYGISLRQYDYALPMSTIMRQINNYHPIYSSWYTADETWGHTVCINGYDYNNEEDPYQGISYMESLGGVSKSVDANSSGKFMITVAGYNITWTWSGVVR